mgnify:CR=1 FL=1
MFCRKCGTEFDGKFCPNCGEPAETIPETPAHQTSINGVPVDNSPVSVPVKEPFQDLVYCADAAVLLFPNRPLSHVEIQKIQ